MLPGQELGVANSQIRCTNLGKYHIGHMARLFQYMDAITIDTPIVDADFRRRIQDAVTIHDRLDRCELFINS